MKPEAIKGALLSVNLTWQIPVIKSTGKKETVELMLMASYQNLNPPIFIKKRGVKPKKVSHQQHYLIQSLPMVGPILAYRLLAYFGSIKEIVLAETDELIKVEGIGKRKAKLLIDFFEKSL
jgi:Fanconi anemia group M protein